MKKISINILALPLFLTIGIQKGYAQNNLGEVVTNPIASPSMASLSRYSDVPINEATGIPNINIPLLSVPMADNGMSFPISLSYNVKNYENAERISDVGFGWSLLGTSVIYKKIMEDLDECYDNPARPGHINNEFDDLYYYALPGLSGKFRIKRDVIANTFTLINLSPNNAKIDYVRDNNTATFKADHFTITADNGYKYYFKEYDYGQYACPDAIAPHSFKTSYFLTKIVNPIGVEIATLQYEKKNYILSTGKIVYQYCKIKSIKTTKGEIVFDFAYDENLKETVNDPFTLNKISLKNPAGEVLYSYLTDNSIVIHPYDDPLKRKRVLNSIRKNDKNNVKIEQTSFAYQHVADEIGRTSDGILEKMILPTGGVVNYNYENNEQFFDYSNPDHLASLDQYGFDPAVQTKETLINSPINTQTTQTYNFTIPGDVSKVKRFELAIDVSDFTYPIPPNPDPNDPFNPQLPQPDIHPSLTFVLKKGNQQIVDKQFTYYSSHGTVDITVNPGNYTLEVSSVDGAKGVGSFQVIGRKFLPGPFRNSIAADGKRIKNIKYFKSLSETTPEKTINYGYDSFTLPNSTSGYLFYSERDSQNDPNTPYILYNSVKVSENGKGYIKKTFKTPDDYPKYQNGGTPQLPTYFWPYYNITRGGLPYKEQIYDEQNKLLISKEINYEFDTYSDVEYNLNLLLNDWQFSKPTYIKKTTQKDKLFYASGRTIDNESETQISNLNFKPNYAKSVVDGDIKEKLMTYPLGLSGYTHLENAYMTGIPVIIEEKENGKTLSKSKTVFANTSLLPTSVIETNIADGTPKENLKMDLYDDRGNLLQFSNSGGFTTALIYGYDKTSLIAKVEGATYSQIASMATDIINASNNDNLNSSTESALITALDNFRKNAALANYQVTTYTYDPLVGITTTTPPSGLREIYEYDLSGKLIKVKRMEKDPGGTITYKTLKEFQYNYKH
ncbi:hypothetical protein [Chryseobacterium herbae]|uniref:YD repeat-containing protein n=1 Tax=Chryseobacterium herbae TaxID=2976476 RepID=A0ABT2IPJ4_9FLAO|nr:hypothetical protein [Chryseobacterium sp. pc1-10]MCT2560743.1 hypothetical protein [Chryseobacterium sp. pc1-10]